LTALAAAPRIAPAAQPQSLKRGWHTMRMSSAVAEWLTEVKTQHPGTATWTAYKSDLHRLVSFASIDTILHFTPELCRNYFASISSQGIRPSTLHRKMAAVSEFGKWGVRNKLWHANPMDGVARVRRPRHLPRPFSNDEMARLFALDLEPVERVMRGMLFLTGLRVTPLCKLKVGDVSYDPPTIRAWVKGAKTQVIQMHPALKDLLYSYTLAHSDLRGQSPLLAQPNGRPYHRKTIERITAEWGVRAQVPACLPHRFRHSFATRLLEAGVDIRLIKEAMGHEDISSTAIYTQVTDAKLAAAIGKLDKWTV